MKFKKLLFVGPYPPPYGGIATHLRDLLPLMAEHGYEVSILTFYRETDKNIKSKNYKSIRYIQNNDAKNADNHKIKQISIENKKYFKYNLPKILFNTSRMLCLKRELNIKSYQGAISKATAINEVAEQEQSDLIFIYGNHSGFVIPMLKQLNINRPLALMIFGDFYLYPRKYVAISKFLNGVFKNADVILASSNYCGNAISAVMGFDFPVKTIYVGVDQYKYFPKNRTEFSDRIGLPADAFVFSFLGRMIKHMGMDFILKIAIQLLDLRDDVYLLLAGAKGDLTSEAEELAQNNSRIKVLVDLSYDDKPEFYAASDVVMAPTLEKRACMGVSIKEAMACGKPIIASTSGGIPEAVEDGVNGYLVPSSEGLLDEKNFLKCAEKLLNNSLLRKNMGENGRSKFLRLFTNDETIRRYINIISNLEQ